MSYLKTTSELYIGVQEINRLQLFLDKAGWRSAVQQYTNKYGLVKNQFSDSLFNNGKVKVASGVGDLTVQLSQLQIIDSSGQFVAVRNVPVNLVIPALNAWYWIKASYATNTNEVGLWSIDIAGNLTCPAANGALTQIIREGKDYPSVVRFINSTQNTAHYAVIKVINDNYAILQAPSFVPEANLTLDVVGSFTPGIPVSSSQYDIFQYDSSNIENNSSSSFVLETTLNTPPTKTQGLEFYLARVRATSGMSGIVIEVQDKRTEIFELDSFAQKTDFITNQSTNFVGVEQARYQNTAEARDRSIVSFGWNIKVNSFDINTTLRTVSLNPASFGGVYFNMSQVTNNSLNGFRLYSPQGNYSTIVNTTVTGSGPSAGVVVELDSLNIDDFSPDGGNTYYTNVIVIAPNAEEIEFEFSNVAFDGVSADKRFVYRNVYPIAMFEGIALLPYTSSASTSQTYYKIRYRYKTLSNYSQWYFIADGSYYNESQFQDSGLLITSPTRLLYSNSLIYVLRP